MHLSKLTALLLCAACGADAVVPPPPPPATFTLSAGEYWAGSPITITSESFREVSPSLSLTVGDSVMALTRIDDVTYGGTLSVRLSGDYTPVLRVDGTDHALGPITVSGATGRRHYDVGKLAPYRGDHTASLLGTVDGKVVRVNLDAETITPVPGVIPVGAFYLTGQTYDPAVWIFQSSMDGPFERWRVTPELRRLDALPSQLLGQSTVSVVAQFTPDATVLFPHDEGWVSHRIATSWGTDLSTMVHMEGDKYAVIAPDGQHAILTTSGISFWINNEARGRRVPVYAAPSGEIAYLLPETWHGIPSADFSPDGSLLAVASGLRWELSYHLGVVDAATGTMRYETDFSDRVIGVAFDPWRPVLYAVLQLPERRRAVVVLDRGDFHVVGRMETECGEGCGIAPFLVVSPHDALYVIGEVGGRQFEATRFGLPSVQ